MAIGIKFVVCEQPNNYKLTHEKNLNNPELAMEIIKLIVSITE